MNTNPTVIVIYVILAVTFIYDGYALMRKGYLNTISWTIYSSSRKWLIIPFLFGILAGHLWFSMEPPPEPCVPKAEENGQK